VTKRFAFFIAATATTTTTAHAGGLILPGSGATSTGRAGASVASVAGAEAVGSNIAGITEGKGTRIAVHSALINYSMTFTRAGSYDTVDDKQGPPPKPINLPWEGEPYGAVSNSASPTVGIGPYQAIPLISVVSDLGGAIPGLHVGFGIVAPNAYPARNYDAQYLEDNPTLDGDTYTDRPPPPSRYDIIEQEAAVVAPTLAVAYRVLPTLDIGAKFGWGIADTKAKVMLWGLPRSYEEWVGNDSLFAYEGHDRFVPIFGGGVRFRPSPMIELGATYTAQINVKSKGIGRPNPSEDLEVIAGQPVEIIPVPDAIAECAPGGVAGELKACVDLSLPQIATIGGRYIIRDATGAERGDIELDVAWENWSAERVSSYRVKVDGEAEGILLKETFIRHNFKDTYSVRLGGGWNFPVGKNQMTARGGFAYDTGAAKAGWERLDIDGAARYMITAGASYKLPKWQFDVGGGAALQGTRTLGTNPPCNPSPMNMGCDGSGMDRDIEDRQGPDPTNPTVEADQQAENPVNQGTYKSRYILFLIGVSTWF
jgi:long-subunit fatty acid transport protein